MRWLKLQTSILDNAVWRDGLGLRLWLWILVSARRSGTPGTVRWSYPTLRQALAYRHGSSTVTPSRKSVRSAMRRLVSDGRVTVTEWAQGPDLARRRGGEQGHLTLEVNNWALYQEERGEREEAGSPITTQGRARKGREVGIPSREEIRKREEKAPAGPSCSDWLKTWNGNRGSLPEVRSINAARRRTIEAALREEPDLDLWAKAIRLKASDPFWVEKKFGADNLLRARSRMGYLDAARGAESEAAASLDDLQAGKDCREW